MNLDNAVNQALDDLELVENERFIALMTALYYQAEDATNWVEIRSIPDAIGHFVPSEKP